MNIAPSSAGEFANGRVCLANPALANHFPPSLDEPNKSTAGNGNVGSGKGGEEKILLLTPNTEVNLSIHSLHWLQVIHTGFFPISN